MRIILQATLEEQASMYREIMMISRDIMEQQVMVDLVMMKLSKMLLLGNHVCRSKGSLTEFHSKERIRGLAEKLNGENQQLQVCR